MENFARLQPMRSFHLIYVIFFAILGGLMGEYVLRRSTWRWLGVFVPLAALRALIAESRIALPEKLPSMVAGLFGYLGYDMVRLMEKLPPPNPDPIGIPDAVLIRPTVIARPAACTRSWPGTARSSPIPAATRFLASPRFEK